MECPQCTFINQRDLRECEICSCILSKKRMLPAECTDQSASNVKVTTTNCGTFNSSAATAGIIELLSEAFSTDRAKFKICSPCLHIRQNGLEGAHWSCGYRNIQMLCSNLMSNPVYRRVLFNGDGDIPDVYGIQSWIEKAWKAGYDVAVRFLSIQTTRSQSTFLGCFIMFTISESLLLSYGRFDILLASLLYFLILSKLSYLVFLLVYVLPFFVLS